MKLETSIGLRIVLQEFMGYTSIEYLTRGEGKGREGNGNLCMGRLGQNNPYIGFLEAMV